MGDPYPISRTGLGRTDRGYEIFNAVCPGERLVAVRLIRPVINPGEKVEVLWEITGDTPLPERLEVGAVPSGMREIAPFTASIASNDRMSLRVETTELRTPYSLEVRAGGLPTDGVEGHEDTYPTVETFNAAVLSKTRCGDPYGKGQAGRYAGIYALFSLAIAGLGTALLIVSARKVKVFRRSGA
jgi:hypothetical protein